MKDITIDKTTHIPQALNIALKREKEAAAFYAKGIEEAEDTGVKKLFQELYEEEKHHIERIQLFIDKEILQDN